MPVSRSPKGFPLRIHERRAQRDPFSRFPHADGSDTSTLYTTASWSVTQRMMFSFSEKRKGGRLAFEREPVHFGYRSWQ